MMKDLQQSQYFQTLTKDEIEMFENLADKESVHNQMGALLSQYRESIIETRNQFVVNLCQKYRVQNPSELMYDPIGQKLVSIYHPNAKASKMKIGSNALRDLASALFLDMIKKLSDAVKLAKKG